MAKWKEKLLARRGEHKLTETRNFVNESLASSETQNQVCARRSFRLKKTDGFRQRFCCPTGAWDNAKQRCGAGTLITNILHPKRRKESLVEKMESGELTKKRKYAIRRLEQAKKRIKKFA